LTDILLKDWLKAEGYREPQLLLAPSTIHQYFMNLERELFRKCFRNKTFPLQLSILFATLAANKSLFCSSFEISDLAQNCHRHWSQHGNAGMLLGCDTVSHRGCLPPPYCIQRHLWKICPKETHPWVRGVLAEASFRPRLMSRWCMVVDTVVSCGCEYL
jgi:hypothetical protein